VTIRTAIRGFALLVGCAVAAAQNTDPNTFTVNQIRAGAGIYAQNCSPCHGARMADPNSAFDLRKFPHDQKGRFVNSVTRGKHQMPPWGDLLKSDDLDALWAYVVAGGKP
jgi:mono/diheme cytochrome c family protein